MTNPPIIDPTINPDPGGNEDPPIDRQWQALLYENNNARLAAQQEAERLRKELEEARRTPPTPPAPLEPGVVHTDPERFAQRVLSDVRETIRPMNDTLASMQRKNDYHDIKTRLKAQNPHLVQLIGQLEPILDKTFLVDNPNFVVNEPAVVAQIKLLIADAALANMQNPGRNPPPNPNPNPPPASNPPARNDIIPPHLQPSARVPATSDPAIPKVPTVNDLNENERRLAREKGYTPEEFIIMRDTPPDQFEAAWRKIKEDRKKRSK